MGLANWEETDAALAQSRAECEALRADVRFLRGEVTKCSVMSEEWGKERKWAGDEIETLRAQLDNARNELRLALDGEKLQTASGIEYLNEATKLRAQLDRAVDWLRLVVRSPKSFNPLAIEQFLRDFADPSQPEPLAAKYRCARHGDCTNQGAPHEGQEPQPEPVKAPAPWHLQRPIVPENAGTTCGACKGCGGFDPKGTPMMGWHVLHGEKYRCAACDGSGRMP